jgi:membrane fusion protein (multidrug efflux system)
MNKAIFVPTSALIPSIKGYSVFIARNGVALSTLVKTGIRSRDYVQVLDGLQIGDTIVTTNLLRIKNESSIKVLKIN